MSAFRRYNVRLHSPMKCPFELYMLISWQLAIVGFHEFLCVSLLSSDDANVAVRSSPSTARLFTHPIHCFMFHIATSQAQLHTFFSPSHTHHKYVWPSRPAVCA